MLERPRNGPCKLSNGWFTDSLEVEVANGDESIDLHEAFSIRLISSMSNAAGTSSGRSAPYSPNLLNCVPLASYLAVSRRSTRKTDDEYTTDLNPSPYHPRRVFSVIFTQKKEPTMKVFPALSPTAQQEAQVTSKLFFRLARGSRSGIYVVTGHNCKIPTG